MVTKLRLIGDRSPTQERERDHGRRLVFPVEAARQLGARPNRPEARAPGREAQSDMLRTDDIVHEVERHLDVLQQKLDRVKKEVAGAIGREGGGDRTDRPSAA
ncbi:MAG: hypothetical protein KF745_08365 [Phycisphaeraceae bacterium]|nr:hypothetical protein [Phycisphaeraceae bacterium]